MYIYKYVYTGCLIPVWRLELEKVTSASLGYPLSVFNKTLLSDVTRV